MRETISGPQAVAVLELVARDVLALVRNNRERAYAASAAAETLKRHALHARNSVSSSEIPAAVEEIVLKGKDDPYR